MNIFKCSLSSDKSNNNSSSNQQQQEQQRLASKEDPVTHQLILSRKKTKKNQTKLPPNSLSLIGTNNKNYIYKPLKKLSSGASNTSDVWQIELIEPHDIKGIYALKRIKLDDLNYDYGSNLLLKQTIDMNIDMNCLNNNSRNNLSNLEHLNIVKYYDSFISQNIGGKYLNILQEFCITSLQKLFDLKQEIPISYQIQWSLHIAQALKYIHDDCMECGRIIHRDVKPDNILLKKVVSHSVSNSNSNNSNSGNTNGSNGSTSTSTGNSGSVGNGNGSSSSISTSPTTTVGVGVGGSSGGGGNGSPPAQSKLIIKLADFDYAKKVDFSNAKTFVGSQEYVAPEIINSLNSNYSSRITTNGNGSSGSGGSNGSDNNNNNKLYYYTHKVDIWSYGVVAFQLIMPSYRLNIPRFREELQKNPNYVRELLKDYLNNNSSGSTTTTPQLLVSNPATTTSEIQQAQQQPNGSNSSKYSKHGKLQSLPNNNHLYLQCLAQIIVDCLQLDPTARPEAKDIVRSIEILYYSTYTKFNSPVKPPPQPQPSIDNNNSTTQSSQSPVVVAVVVENSPNNSVPTSRTSLSSDKSSDPLL